ncbi:long-chain-fatty-acid--CoA ligase [Fundidesulfovibrio soli]|uniref:long-chain-fatty-acid--CoA ligase n=1 Tax=Fundidesulfovibrio soli TaxID=2922716 RepID=UPI001FAED89E|nr:long-chain fatty acid--CoA ligase [Fundidesulfovibrio soli]
MTYSATPWIDHYDPGVPSSIDYRLEPVTALLDFAAECHPKRTAVLFRNLRMDYATLRHKAGRFARGLRDMGIQPGDRVAIMLPNLPQTIVAYWGALYAGAVAVFVNPLYMDTELTHILQDSGARVLIVLDLLWERHRPILEASALERIIVTRISDGLAFPMDWLYRLSAWRQGKFPRLELDGKRTLPFVGCFGSEPYHIEGVDPVETTALLQYTGGTTGISKGVVLTHHNLSCNIQQAKALLSVMAKETEVFLGLLPFFHIYGLQLLVNFATANAAAVAPVPRFDPLETLKAIARYRPTVFPGTPSVYMALLQQKALPDFDLTCVHYCVSGSAPLPVEVLRRFKEITRAEIVEGFGLTEASPFTHVTPLQGRRKPGSIGLPFPDTQARIVDLADGVTPMPPGSPGELLIRGPQVMRGYWNRPGDTEETLRGGWLYTGDIAVMDEEGYFFIVDRKKDMIISGGFNVYPREIEEVLHTHPGVQEVAAIGVPHRSRGEVVKVYIVPKPGLTLTREEVMAFCKAHLAAYKAPRFVEFRTELPKTFVGKVLRRTLRAENPQHAPEARA